MQTAVESDAGLLACRELDDALDLSALDGETLSDAGSGQPANVGSAVFWRRLMELFYATVYIFLIGMAYALPTVIAYSRRHPNRHLIMLINVFTGFTGIGWLVALVWAIMQEGSQFNHELLWNRRNWREIRMGEPFQTFLLIVKFLGSAAFVGLLVIMMLGLVCLISGAKCNTALTI